MNELQKENSEQKLTISKLESSNLKYKTNESLKLNCNQLRNQLNESLLKLESEYLGKNNNSAFENYKSQNEVLVNDYKKQLSDLNQRLVEYKNKEDELLSEIVIIKDNECKLKSQIQELKISSNKIEENMKIDQNNLNDELFKQKESNINRI